jgi:transketolase
VRKAFAEAAEHIAIKDPRVLMIVGDEEAELGSFKNKFPERFYNVGICEQSMIGLAAGLAISGFRPIVHTITPFLIERPFEQIKIDIDEQNLPVILVGFSDYPKHGATHRSLNPERLSMVFKNIQSFFPSSEEEAQKNLYDAYLMHTPAIIHLRKTQKPII